MVMKRIIYHRALYIMMLPAVIFLLINNYLPMLGLVLAFKNYNYADGLRSPWCGFDNFKFLFETPDAWRITRNTVGYNFLFITLGLIFTVAFAIALNEIVQKKLSKTFQTILLFPYFLSWVVVAYVGYALMHTGTTSTGFLNTSILPLFGIKPVDWYSTPQVWPFILPIVNLWKNVGYGTVIYMAAIAGFDQQLYEAAVIDGASKWKQIKHITLPLLQPLMIILTIFAIGSIFRSDFGLFYQFTLNQGGIMDTTSVIDTYIFNALLNNNDFGMTSAAGLYQSVVGLVLILLANWTIRKIDPEKALF